MSFRIFTWVRALVSAGAAVAIALLTAGGGSWASSIEIAPPFGGDIAAARTTAPHTPLQLAERRSCRPGFRLCVGRYGRHCVRPSRYRCHQGYICLRPRGIYQVRNRLRCLTDTEAARVRSSLRRQSNGGGRYSFAGCRLQYRYFRLTRKIRAARLQTKLGRCKEIGWFRGGKTLPAGYLLYAYPNLYVYGARRR